MMNQEDHAGQDRRHRRRHGRPLHHRLGRTASRPRRRCRCCCMAPSAIVAGGAANVAANAAALGAAVALVGLVGHDQAAEQLRSVLADHVAIDLSGLVIDSGAADRHQDAHHERPPADRAHRRRGERRRLPRM